jgi:hypothetical protein
MTPYIYLVLICIIETNGNSVGLITLVVVHLLFRSSHLLKKNRGGGGCSRSTKISQAKFHGKPQFVLEVN